MKRFWKKVIAGIAIAAILSSQAGTASAGRFGSAVAKAAGSAVKSRVSGGSSSTLRKAASAVQKVTQGNGVAGRVLGTAQQVIQNSDSPAVKVLTKAVTDPNSLTGRVVRRIDNVDSNSLAGKLIDKAAGGDSNSLTSRVLNRAKNSAGDPNSLTNRTLNKAKVAVDETKAPAGRLFDRAKLAAADPTTPAGRVFDRAKLAIENGNQPAGGRFADRIKQVIEKNGGVEAVVAEVAGAANAAADVVAPADAAVANPNNQLVGQLLSAGIQAGGNVLGSAIEARAAGGFVSGGGGGFAPVAAPEPVALPAVEEAAPIAAPIAAPVATTDLELSDLRFVDNGNNEQGPLYRLTVKNLGNTNVTSEVTVVLLASMEKDSDDNVSVLGSLESLEAGATKTVDLRLPKGSQALTFLTAAVALTDAADANETDNVVTVATDSVRLAH